MGRGLFTRARLASCLQQLTEEKKKKKKRDEEGEKEGGGEKGERGEKRGEKGEKRASVNHNPNANNRDARPELVFLVGCPASGKR